MRKRLLFLAMLSTLSLNNVLVADEDDDDDDVEVVDDQKNPLKKLGIDVSGDIRAGVTYNADGHSPAKRELDVYGLSLLNNKDNQKMVWDAKVKKLSFGRKFKSDDETVLDTNVTLTASLPDKTVKLKKACATVYDAFTFGFSTESCFGKEVILASYKFTFFECINAYFGISDPIDLDKTSNDFGGLSYGKTSPAFDYALQYNFNDEFGNVKLGALVRPASLKKTYTDNNEEKEYSQTLIGFGSKLSTELHLIKDVSKLEASVAFGSGVGEYMDYCDIKDRKDKFKNYVSVYAEDKKNPTDEDKKAGVDHELFGMKAIECGLSYSHKLSSWYGLGGSFNGAFLLTDGANKDTLEDLVKFAKMFKVGIDSTFYLVDGFEMNLGFGIGYLLPKDVDKLIDKCNKASKDELKTTIGDGFEKYDKDKNSIRPFCFNVNLGVKGTF